MVWVLRALVHVPRVNAPVTARLKYFGTSGSLQMLMPASEALKNWLPAWRSPKRLNAMRSELIVFGLITYVLPAMADWAKSSTPTVFFSSRFALGENAGRNCFVAI